MGAQHADRVYGKGGREQAAIGESQSVEDQIADELRELREPTTAVARFRSVRIDSPCRTSAPSMREPEAREWPRH
jgi:hypothetical protein